MIKQKIPRINGIKQEFEIISFSENFEKLIVSDKHNKIIEVTCIDLPSLEKIDTRKIKRGMRLITIASRSKIKLYGKKVITHILNILPALQTDIEDFL